jgi:hypothetical protein
VLPSQQPLGQLDEAHTHCPVAVLQSWPLPHAWHVTPPAPHVVAVSLAYGTHMSLLQHPFAQAVPPQVQVPSLQACPATHPPQATPPVPHFNVLWTA